MAYSLYQGSNFVDGWHTEGGYDGLATYSKGRRQIEIL